MAIVAAVEAARIEERRRTAAVEKSRDVAKTLADAALADTARQQRPPTRLPRRLMASSLKSEALR